MPAPFGDLGQTLLTFEQTLTLKKKGQTQIVDGYAEESTEKQIQFEGVIVPVYSLQLEERGAHWKGDSILYVRISQDTLPEIELQDIVIDEEGQQWKVLGAEDYSQHGCVMLYDIQKVTGKC